MEHRVQCCFDRLENSLVNCNYNGWLNTGDIGYIDLNGGLHITDRIDDMIIINSHKIYPGNIEHEILKISEIQECVVLKSDIYKKTSHLCVCRLRDKPC